jgi:adenylate kinase family enzyme
MPRIVIVGNSGGGKSTLARRLAERRRLRHVEIDRLLWQDGWVLTPEGDYARQHREIIGQEDWLIDGLGRQDSIAERIGRATEIILIDMPLWMHFWLAAERQIAWAAGPLEHAPAGIARMPPTRDLFRTIWEVDRDWMPGVRALCTEAEAEGKIVTRLASVDEIDAFAATL